MAREGLRTILAGVWRLARHYPTDAMERAIDLCESVLSDVQDFVRNKRLRIGNNVESVSIRKSEVDASVELFRRWSARIGG